MFLQWTSYVCLVQKYLPGFILLNGVLIAVNVIFQMSTFANQFMVCWNFIFILFVEDYFSQDFYWDKI